MVERLAWVENLNKQIIENDLFISFVSGAKQTTRKTYKDKGKLRYAGTHHVKNTTYTLKSVSLVPQTGVLQPTYCSFEILQKCS